MKPEILAVVKINDGEALVLKELPKLEYTKYGDDTIIGTDGYFYIFYGYERMSPNWKAFAGREFDLTMKDGEVIHCEGQWWDKITQRAVNELNINDDENKIVYAIAGSIDNLKRCYVFCGYKTLKNKWEEMRSMYSGKVYEYWEYDKILKNKK